MKRTLSFLLTLLMLVTSLPLNAFTAFATGVEIPAPSSLDDIAWEDLTYRDIFIDNNPAYLDGFEKGDFHPYVQSAGINTVTAAVCATGKYSLQAFGSPSQQIISASSQKAGEYFVASKVYCTRYAKGELGICLGDTTVGVTKVTEGFETASGILTKTGSHRIFIGSIHSADLDGYVDDPVVVSMELFTTKPTASELTALYEHYVELESKRDRSEAIFSDSHKLNTFMSYLQKKSQEIGMTSSTFGDPMGNSCNLSTPRDLAKLLAYASNYSQLDGIWSLASKDISVMGLKARTQSLTSTVIKPALTQYYTILGGKTGTLNSTRNLAVILEIPESEDRFVVVAMSANGKDGAAGNRYQAIKEIADLALEKYADASVDLSGKDVCCDGAIACLLTPEGEISVLYEKDADTQRYPASITKVLTAVCALDLIDDLNTTVTYKPFDVSVTPWNPTDFSAGDSVSLEDALCAMLLPSSNLTSFAVARTAGGVLLDKQYSLAGKVISILSASTSTFEGYTPVADGFNLDHRDRYPQDNLLTHVNDTWWMQTIQELNAKLGINDSWAGSQVLNTQDTNSGDLGPDAAMASITRIKNLGANGTPDVILFFGGGNDMGRGVALGSFDPATAPTEVDLTATKWESFADAYVAAIMRLQYFYPDAKILAMTSYPMPSYVTQAKLDKYGPVVQAICEHYGVEYLSLQDCGVTFEMLPDNIHPNAEGMDYITAAVVEKLTDTFVLPAGETVVHTVTHNLTEVKASLGYYKGISANKAFEETLTGEEFTVTVTMDGVDITATAYQNGVISIPAVTGDLVITAKGKFNAEGHLQALPEVYCPATNLWQALTPEKIYYTATGWGNTSAGDSWSITFPVKEGDRIWATSLGAYPDNGSTANGVRITWFDENGVLQTLSRDVAYAEFAKNGYITAPEGAVALNLPMTGNEAHYAVYILSAEHRYGRWAETKAPTYTENGKESRTCTVCGNTEERTVPKLEYTHAVPQSQGVANAIQRAYALTDVLWTPLKNMPGVIMENGVYRYQEFIAGVTYQGVPYSGVIDTDTYIGLSVDLGTFLSALQDENSVLYAENLFAESYPKKATYYGTVCSKFMQYVLNVPGAFNTANVPNIPGMETIALPGKYLASEIRLGDVLVDTDYHTAICTDLLYDAEGNLAFIEISEAISPTARRLLWSVEEFCKEFATYRLCRYWYIDNVPAAKETHVEEDPALMPAYGNGYLCTVSASQKDVVHVLQAGYAKAMILRDGKVIEEISLTSETTSFNFDRSLPGQIEIYLVKENGEKSESVFACVVKTSITVTDSTSFFGGKLTVEHSGSHGTPLYVQIGSGQSVFCPLTRDLSAETVSFDFSRVSSYRVRVAYETAYGIALSPWVSFQVDESQGTGKNPSNDPMLSQGAYWDGMTLTPGSSKPIHQAGKENYWTYSMIPVLAGETYESVGANRMWFFDQDGNPISTYNAYTESAIPFRFTTPAGTAYVSLSYAPELVEKGTETLIAVHSYTATVTQPTATTQGYTTYTCEVCGDSYVSDYTDFTGFDSYEEAVKYLREQMVARVPSITVRLYGVQLDENQVYNFRNDAWAHTGVPNEGDYIRQNCLTTSCSAVTGTDDKGIYTEMTFNTTWFTTAAQEAEVDAAVAELLAEWNLESATDYQKIKCAYDWVCTNVVYDHDNLYDSTYLLKHSSYAALIHRKAVCQGFASLFYRLCLELGVDCRVIIGYTDESHAWNIVKLGDKYYNMDPTYDRGTGNYYRYFLTTIYSFGGHDRNAEYETDAFNAAYPMATLPYVEKVAASGTLSNGMEWILDGDTGVLTVTGKGAIPDYRQWNAPWEPYSDSILGIELSEGITQVGDRAFAWCKNATYLSLPSTLKVICEYGFNNCRSLTEIDLPDGLTTLEFCAFSECSGLQSVYISAKLTNIGSSVFSNCPNIATIEFGEGFTHIADSMFSNTAVKELILPDTIVSIGSSAFARCEKLTYVRIPASVTYISHSAFINCSKLRQIGVVSDNPNYLSSFGVLFTKDAKTLVCFPAGMIPDRGTYTVPTGVTTIGDSAFYGASHVTRLVIPDSVTLIDDYAFAFCDGLYSVDIGPNVTRLGDTAFGFCTALTSITFANPKMEIDNYCFTHCVKLKSFTFPAEIPALSPGILTDCHAITEIEIPKNVSVIESGCFQFMKSLKKVTIPANITKLENCAFFNCTALEEVVIEGNLSFMDWSAFDTCSLLKFVHFKGSVASYATTTDRELFRDCPLLFAVYFDDAATAKKVTSATAFGNLCKNALTVAVPAGTTELSSFITTNYPIRSTVSKDGVTYDLYSKHNCSWTTEGDAITVDCERRMPQYCSICRGKRDQISYVHSYWEEYFAPTCTEEGKYLYTCTVCGYSFEESIPAGGHYYDYVITDPTCTEEGRYDYFCLYCDHTYTEPIPPLGHSFEAWYTVTDATCTADGEQRRDCKACEHYETQAIPATGHSYNAVVTEPTCTEQGYTTYTCHCGDSYVADYIDATGHSFGEWYTVTEPTCTADGEQRRDCENCDHYETQAIPATGHNYESVVTKPTCTEKGYTTYTCHCGDSYVADYTDPTGHSFGEWYTVKDATCTENGTERRDCANCEHYETNVLPATGHNYNAAVTKPTCTEQGYTTYTCHCGDSYVADYIAPTGHSFGEWYTVKDATCTAEGMERRDCANCDHYEPQAIPATGHSYNAVVTKPTCTEKGYTTYTCHCGDSYVDNYVDATGHAFGEWYTVTEPTCITKGTERRDCKTCDHYETQAIPATGHSYNAVVTTPTCTEKGYTTYTCHCGDSYVDNYVDATGHSFGEWYTVTAPTCTADGEQRRDCANCDHYET
ncbi:MAG: leucine-rich repeat protein, partial [Clostridia bacterium]|nr:leucine-rich repeat protein [Clostridia bacterium]